MRAGSTIGRRCRSSFTRARDFLSGLGPPGPRQQESVLGVLGSIALAHSLLTLNATLRPMFVDLPQRKSPHGSNPSLKAWRFPRASLALFFPP